MNKVIIAGIASIIVASIPIAALAQYYDPNQAAYQAAQQAAAAEAWARSGANNAVPGSPNYGRVPGTDIFDPNYIRSVQMQQQLQQQYAYPYNYSPYGYNYVQRFRHWHH